MNGLEQERKEENRRRQRVVDMQEEIKEGNKVLLAHKEKL